MKLNQTRSLPGTQVRVDTQEIDAYKLAEQFEALFKKLDTMQKQLNNLEEALVEKIEDDCDASEVDIDFYD